MRFPSVSSSSLCRARRADKSKAGDLADLRADISPKLLTPEVSALRLPVLSLPEWEMKIARDPLGLEIARRLPGGVVAMWKRDLFGRPQQRQVLTGAFPGREPTSVSRAGYQWSGPDQIASITDTQTGATRYEYDPRGHLIRALFPDGAVQHRESDAVSNLFKTADRSDRRYGRGGVLERAGGNEYRYDGHGNLIEKVLADGARWKYVWTPSGRLSEVIRPDGERVAFTYDALGRRVRKEYAGTTTEYVWDGDDLVHERRTVAGEHQPLVTWLFEPGTFAPVAKLEGKKRYSVVTDHLGTPSMLMTEAGKLAWKAQLDVYGVPREESAGIAKEDATYNPWRYPGQYEDAETGLYYNRFRYYDPETGRYISEDPIGLDGGLKAFGYVDDPLRWGDPFGLKACNIDKDTVKRLEETKPNLPGNWHMHHIVMEGVFSHWKPENRAFIEKSKAILEKFGISLQKDANVVWAENQGHSVEYAKRVHDALDRGAKEGKQGVLKVLQDFADEFRP